MKPPKPIPPKPKTQEEIAELYAFALEVENGWMEARAEREQRDARYTHRGSRDYVAQTRAANG